MITLLSNTVFQTPITDPTMNTSTAAPTRPLVAPIKEVPTSRRTSRLLRSTVKGAVHLRCPELSNLPHRSTVIPVAQVARHTEISKITHNRQAMVSNKGILPKVDLACKDLHQVAMDSNILPQVSMVNKALKHKAPMVRILHRKANTDNLTTLGHRA